MRHLMTLAFCLLPALALGQSAVTVRGPAGSNADRAAVESAWMTALGL